MENATHALLIAGGVLITMLIIAVIVTTYVIYNNSSEDISSSLDVTEINKYNSNFIAFEDRTNINAQEIVTLINLSKQRKYEIKIIITTKTGTIAEKNRDWTNATTQELNQFLKDHILINSVDNAGVNIYKNTFSYVDMKYDDKSGKICEISFEEN